MNQDHPRQKITVEDLLRFKRAERPPAEFWTKFEADLRAKQLAAIVAKQPWWRVLPRTFAGVARLHLPVGATAVMAVTIFAIGGYRVVSVDREIVSPPASQSVLVRAESIPAADLASVATPPETAVEIAPEHPAVNPGETSAVIASVETSSLAGDTQQFPTRFTHAVINENLGKHLAEESQIAAAELAMGLTGTHSFETRAVLARASREPLAQVRTPMDDRRERYLGTSLPAGYTAETSTARATSRSDEIVNRRFNERRFQENDGVSRFGAYGAGVSIKL